MQTQLFAVGSLEESSHANLTAQQEKDLEQKTNAIYGQKCLEQFKKLSQIGLWQKMFAELLIGQMDWFSSKSTLIWKMKATRSNRLYFQLAVSTLHTEETEYGLLPTPTVMDTNGGDLEKIDLRRQKLKAKKINGNGFGASLGELANRGFLPIPSTTDWNTPLTKTTKEKFLTNRGEKNLEAIPSTLNSLHQLAYDGLLPTPAAQNYKGASSTEALKARGRLKQKADNLADQFAQSGKTSQLNPRFVLEMMGFPTNYCDSAYEKIVWELYQNKKLTKSFQQRIQDGEKKPLKQQETQ